ncbi:hypothetical protein P7C71_g4520, partial [Lecanoromycetidae sp. Uapishka_2]
MLQVPTVTQNDLHVFHARVFGSAAPPTGLLDRTQESEHGPTVDYDGQDEEVTLGYYPDGNKRTLTDEQIAMFRHSEIYSIIRERQIRRENEEADGVEIPGKVIPDVEEGARISVPLDVERGLQPNDDSITAAERPEERISKGSTIASSGIKRKRHEADFGDTREPTHRRLARELDSVITTDEVLDYGDEPSVPEETPATWAKPSQQAAASNIESVASTIDQNEQGPDAPLEGKRIWWPILGT